jgi:predicted TIM-barrel fold metal-dependent hydrolase
MIKETVMRATDHYVVISSDCHAGASHAQYREYLDPQWRDEFDAWRGKYSNPFRDLQTDGRTRNWDGAQRIDDQEAEGVVAEVLFPNTVPPFFPTGSVIAPAPNPTEFPARLAGIRAHNRWLADFCAQEPNRRAGQTQIFLNDVDEAVNDIVWGHEHGLRGVLLPGVSPDTPWIEPLFSRIYDPIWQVCQERGIPVTHHAGGTGVPKLPKVACSVVMFVMEAGFWANRALWHITMSGVFDRFPGLTLVLTEQGTSWIPDVLDRMDQLNAEMRRNGRIGELGIDDSVVLPHQPSDYFRRNVFVGSAFPSPSDAFAMRTIGIDRIMWGSDYPHLEGTSPHSRESLRRTFAGWKPEELKLVLSENAARVYGFDLAELAPLADAHGPTVAELATPLTELPENQSPAFSRR